jgi:hypothetical protein
MKRLMTLMLLPLFVPLAGANTQQSGDFDIDHVVVTVKYEFDGKTRGARMSFQSYIETMLPDVESSIVRRLDGSEYGE